MPWRGGGPCERHAARWMPDLAALTAALRAMLPAGTGIGGCRLAEAGPLWPGEFLPGAVPARRLEFAAGRTAARAALTSAGHPAMAIPVADDRAPVWPDGFFGSVTHAGDIALAAVLRGTASPGIDLEPDQDLPVDVVDTVLSPAERAALPDLRHARAAFSAKEAFFKAQYPFTGAMIGFDAAAVDLQSDGFRLTVLHPLPGLPAGTRLSGGLGRVAGWVVTAMVIA